MKLRKCLICRERVMEAYGICESCKKMNEEKRNIHRNLTGYTALVTGARIKIGYATALRLLRDGATVIGITRFPCDAIKRYSEEQDYENFRDRLHIIGFDLMRIDRIPALISLIEELCPDGLDILINNSAQTVRKSRQYYIELAEHEEKLKLGSSANLPAVVSVENGNFQIERYVQLPEKYEETGNYNSWVAKPEEITPQEMLEVQLINVTAPFMLTTRLKGLMKKGSERNRFVINVSSVEGRFNKKVKLARHVHTNMAKASLNMMTHSLAMDYERDRIYMYSVDPGWVSNQFPQDYRLSKDFEQYLSFDDGASRLCNPIYMHLDDEKVKDAGTFFKDYCSIDF